MAKKAEIKKSAARARKKPETSGIKVDAKPHNLGLIRKFINTGMKKQGFPQEKISALKVSLTEHCENLIRHAYGRKTGSMEIKMELKFPAARITVLDSGPGFDMTAYEIPDTSRRLKKGLGGKMGLKTILALCDRVEYRRRHSHNENIFILGRKKNGKVKK